MSYKIAEQGQLITAPVHLIWESLINISEWNHWMPRVDRVELLESPKPDAIGRMQMGGLKRSFRITQIAPGATLQWETVGFFGTRLQRSYHLIKNAEGTILTLEAFCSGRWESQVKFLMQAKAKTDLMAQAKNLKFLCEERFKAHAKGASEAPVALAS